MAFTHRLAVVLLLLLAPGAQAAADHANDGRCLGTLYAAINVLDLPQNAEEFADELARYQQVRAAWLQALKDDPSIDPATLQSIMDASRAEHARWAAELGKPMSDEAYASLQLKVVVEADTCIDYAPVAAN